MALPALTPARPEMKGQPKREARRQLAWTRRTMWIIMSVLDAPCVRIARAAVSLSVTRRADARLVVDRLGWGWRFRKRKGVC